MSSSTARLLALLLQVEAEVAEPLADEAALDDFEGRQFLGDEEHLFALEHGGGDDVGDALALASTGRAVKDDVGSLPDPFDGERLRRVGIDDMIQAVDRNDVIEVRILGIAGGGGGKP